MGWRKSEHRENLRRMPHFMRHQRGLNYVFRSQLLVVADQYCFIWSLFRKLFLFGALTVDSTGHAGRIHHGVWIDFAM